VTTNDAREVLDRLEADTFAELYKSRWDAAHAETVVPALISCLKVSDTAVLHRALSALARIGPEAQQAIDAVIRLMFHADPLIADAAIHALGRISLKCPERAVAPLVHAASKPATQKPALFALIGFGRNANSTASAFATAFASRDARIRRLALRGLKEIGADASIAEPIVALALKDTNAEVRAAAKKLSVSVRKG
jgi:HEAT repeat protein